MNVSILTSSGTYISYQYENLYFTSSRNRKFISSTLSPQDTYLSLTVVELSSIYQNVSRRALHTPQGGCPPREHVLCVVGVGLDYSQGPPVNGARLSRATLGVGGDDLVGRGYGGEQCVGCLSGLGRGIGGSGIWGWGGVRVVGGFRGGRGLGGFGGEELVGGAIVGGVFPGVGLVVVGERGFFYVGEHLCWGGS
ncbi:hypothetical protein Tco_1215974 [Tanacetum coccineum]